VAVTGGAGAGKYREGAVCTASAETPEGKQFLKWIKNGADASVNAEYSFNVREDSRLLAVFGDAVADAGGEAFTVKTLNGIGGGGYAKGSLCTVKYPVSEDARVFCGWEADGEIVSLERIYTFPVTADVTLEAKFLYTRLAVPDNSDNKMFNLIAGNPVIEYDRQTDPVTGETVTAFTQGVAYIKLWVYTSDADGAEPISAIKICKRENGSGYLSSMDDAAIHELSGNPGNYYTPDGNTHNYLKNRIPGYSTTVTYYFATQAIAQPEAGYIDSEISGKGRGVLSM
jgi:hypothetical protein